MLGSHAYYLVERLMDPATVSACYASPPSKLAAVFFAPKLPCGAQMMRRLIEYGTDQEQFVHLMPARIAEFTARDKGLK